MSFPQNLQEFKSVVLAMATTGVDSLMGWTGPYESLRRCLSKLGGIKEKYSRFVLEKDFADDVALVGYRPHISEGTHP